MITVSTTSDTEAKAATYALEDGLPPEMPYRVYLHGNLFSDRARPAAGAEARSLWHGL